MEALAPADSVGTITGDLSGRRGRISGTDTRARGMMAINAQVPLAELEGYASQLKSMTGGQGSYNIEFSHYEAVPADIQQRLCDAHQQQNTG
jgi:elongation factor G